MKNYSKLISYLFHSRTQAHFFHLQTPSFAAHKALNDYYDGIIDLVDGLAESYQGKYGIMMDYTSFSVMNYEGQDQIIGYFETLVNIVEQLRQNGAQDSYIQNQIDEIVSLINSTIYKLKFLK